MIFSSNKKNSTRDKNDMSSHYIKPLEGSDSVKTNEDFSRTIDECLKNIDISDHARDAIKKSIIINFNEHLSTSKLKERLSILFEYEKNYLSLVKEFKEEIKFIGTLQEDIRKERAKFFSDTLHDVAEALKEAQVPSEVSSQWIQELVNSYTKSLDVSSNLVEEHTFDSIGNIRNKAKNELNISSSINQPLNSNET